MRGKIARFEPVPIPNEYRRASVYRVSQQTLEKEINSAFDVLAYGAVAERRKTL